MAYTRPDRWAHGDQGINAAAMNKYSDSLNALHVITGDAKLNYAVLWTYESFDSITHADSEWYMVHQFRYLIYQSDEAGNGEIVDPSGANASTDLPDTEGAIGSYDLTQISWLTVGRLYQVKDAIFAVEDEDA